MGRAAAIRSWANTDSCTATNAQLFDHLIGTQEEGLGDCHPDCFCGLEIDHQLEFGWILDGQLARLCTAQDAIDLITRVQRVYQMTQSTQGWAGLLKAVNLSGIFDLDALNSILTAADQPTVSGG